MVAQSTFFFHRKFNFSKAIVQHGCALVVSEFLSGPLIPIEWLRELLDPWRASGFLRCLADDEGVGVKLHVVHGGSFNRLGQFVGPGGSVGPQGRLADFP